MKEDDRNAVFFFTKLGNVYHKIMLKDVLYIQANQNYCLIHLEDRRFIVKTSLVKLMKKLPGNKFIRIHKSYVVSINQVTQIDFTAGILVLEGERKLPVGRAYRQMFLAGIPVI